MFDIIISTLILYQIFYYLQQYNWCYNINA
nr:MAG TPA: hypothetical protein [Caudoviricetes sp.]